MDEDTRLIGKYLTSCAYTAFGTGTGIIFGIEPHHREALEMVSSSVIEDVGTCAKRIAKDGKVPPTWENIKVRLLEEVKAAEREDII